MWLFLQLGGPFCGCPYSKSGSLFGPLISGNSHTRVLAGKTGQTAKGTTLESPGSIEDADQV